MDVDEQVTETVQDDSLIHGRQRRSKAGSRMQALIETEFERGVADEEDDEDFFGKEEEDQFDDDFESTDEEAGAVGDEEGEIALQKEEKASQKAGRAASTKGKKNLRYDPNRPPTTSTGGAPAAPRKSTNRRVSLGVAFDAETGQTVELDIRQSRRAAAIRNKQEVQERLQDARDRRASITKKPKLATRSKTQDELIAEALDMEDRNTHDLKHWMEREEEKRLKARIVRQTIHGPMIRWISRGEDVKVRKVVEVVEESEGLDDKAKVTGTTASATTAQITTTQATTTTTQASQTTTPPTQASTSIPATATAPTPTPATAPAPANYSSAWTPAAPPYRPNAQNHAPYPYPPGQYPSPGYATHYPPYFHQYTHYYGGTPGHYSYGYSGGYQPYPPTPATAPAQAPPPSPPKHVFTKEKQARNYVAIQLDHSSITWAETMTAIFGDHVDWSKLTTVPTKNRPAVHRLPTCPITGLPAPYICPRSGVPYANARAYRVVQQLLRHEFIWSEEIGCYVGGQESAFVPPAPRKAPDRRSTTEANLISNASLDPSAAPTASGEMIVDTH